MRNQDPVTNEFKELGKNILNFGRTFQHCIGNASDLCNARIQFSFRIHKGLETIYFLPIPHQYSADLNNYILSGRKACGFQVKCHILICQRAILCALNGKLVIHIVYVIALTAVKNFNILVSAGDFGGTFPIFHRMQSIGEGVDTAVVCNSHSLVTPSCRLLDCIGSFGQSIHIAHRSVQVQFHTLFAGSSILPLFHFTGHNIVRPKDLITGITILHHSAFNSQNLACLYLFTDRGTFFRFHKSIDTNRAGIIRHIERNDPSIAFFQFSVIDIKHPAFHDHGAGIHRDILHGDIFSLEGAAIDSLSLFLDRLLCF